MPSNVGKIVGSGWLVNSNHYLAIHIWMLFPSMVELLVKVEEEYSRATLEMLPWRVLRKKTPLGAECSSFLIALISSLLVASCTSIFPPTGTMVSLTTYITPVLFEGICCNAPQAVSIYVWCKCSQAASDTIQHNILCQGLFHSPHMSQLMASLILKQ